MKPSDELFGKLHGKAERKYDNVTWVIKQGSTIINIHRKMQTKSDKKNIHHGSIFSVTEGGYDHYQGFRSFTMAELVEKCNLRADATKIGNAFNSQPAALFDIDKGSVEKSADLESLASRVSHSGDAFSETLATAIAEATDYWQRQSGAIVDAIHASTNELKSHIDKGN